MDFVQTDKAMMKIDDDTERIAKEIVDSAYQVHNLLGPGLLESAYEVCLAHELELRGLKIERQVEVPFEYKGIRIDAGFVGGKASYRGS